MGKLAVLTLGEGDFQRGFPVTLQIGEEGEPASTQDTGYLPPNTDMLKCYTSWQSTYHSYIRANVRLEKPAAQTTNFSIDEVNQKADSLSHNLNQWLKSQPFLHIREVLLAKLKPNEEVRFIIQTPETQIRQLPWHLWDLIEERYPKAEIGLSLPKYDRVPPHINLTNKVNILAILGEDTGIDVEQDREIIRSIHNTNTRFLVKPQRKDISDNLWDMPCNILFFAGHSRTEDERGRIYINEAESLTIGELKYALKRAIASGLQLAIFNSCDGLGLAQELADLQISQLIVMREPVPDKVTQEFLKYFINAFASGKSFYLAVREARERLQGLEAQFPCASWLPVICQNPAAMPPTWNKLCGRIGDRVSSKAWSRENQKQSQQLWITCGAILLLVLAGFWQGKQAEEFRKELARIRAIVEGTTPTTTSEDKTTEKQILEEKIDKFTAEEKAKIKAAVIDTINRYLQAKQRIFSPPFDIGIIDDFQTDNMYQNTIQSVEWLKKNNAYYKYSNQTVKPVGYFITDGKLAIIDVKLDEDYKIYVNGSIDESNSTEGGIFRYVLKLENNQWKISDRRRQYRLQQRRAGGSQ